jgi:hypothetical protein
MIYRNTKKKYYYFCAYKDRFDMGASVVEMDSDGHIKTNANAWKASNGYDRVFVYDMNHSYIGQY